jgi:hypothetical protein
MTQHKFGPFTWGKTEEKKTAADGSTTTTTTVNAGVEVGSEKKEEPV